MGWADSHDTAFRKVKYMLASVIPLQPRTSLKTIMRRIPSGCLCVGLLHILGTFKRTKSERGYLYIDKEAHFIYRGIQKFNSYLSEKHLILITDHKLLLGISNSSKGLPQCLPHGFNDTQTSFLDIHMT